jgi:hypothetical protein
VMRHCCGKHLYILKAATETEVEARTLGERPSIDKFKRDILVKMIKRGKVCGSFCCTLNYAKREISEINGKSVIFNW